MLIKIEQLHENVYYNQGPGDLAALLKSIKEMGIMNPLLVEKEGYNKYRIVDGIRRFRVAKLLDLKELPCELLTQF